MAILDRLSTLLRANVHAAIDKAEDPEKMLDQLIRDAEDARNAGQRQLVVIATERNRIAAEALHEEKRARKAMTQAETAVRIGNDELAREALRRRHDAVEAANLYSQQAEAHERMVERLKLQLGQMDTKLRRMRQERDTLIARQRVAGAQLSVVTAAQQLSSVEIEGSFSRMSRRVRQSEAMAAATQEVYADSLEGRLDALEDEQVEAQLLAIKERSAETVSLPADARLAAIEADYEDDSRL